MASVVNHAAEGSRSGGRKIYITYKKPRGYVRRQKKVAGNKCVHRKGCGASNGTVPRKKRIKSKD